MKLTNCRSCEARIWWAVTFRGKSTPMEAKPDDRGEWVVDGQTENGAPKVRQVDPLLDPPSIPRFQTHWATCPHADKHRRKRNR